MRWYINDMHANLFYETELFSNYFKKSGNVCQSLGRPDQEIKKDETAFIENLANLIFCCISSPFLYFCELGMCYLSHLQMLLWT